MGYRIRVLGKKLDMVPLTELQLAAKPALLEADEGVEDTWGALTLKHPSGEPIAFMEKNLVVPGELGAEEIEEFIEEVSQYPPASAAAWLAEYLPGVQVIYAFQVLNGAYTDDGFELLHKVYTKVWNAAGGILQADAEGFSNEEGYTVLWQFSDEVSGTWNVAVLGDNGQWISFVMDLGDQAHRQAFWRGEVPSGVKPMQGTENAGS
jgi:hypothetical protein